MKDKRILVVDDREFDRQLIRKALQKKGPFQIIEASNAEECLTALNAHKMDLVLLDIIMPGTNGIKLLTQIREKFNPVDLPIIMVTIKTDAPNIIECLQNGANDYITKPVNFEVALSRITLHLKLAEMSREISKLKESKALKAMIITYNHEINNALAIAMAHLEKMTFADATHAKKLHQSLQRIADIMKKIRSVSDQDEVEYENYVGSTKMVKVK